MALEAVMCHIALIQVGELKTCQAGANDSGVSQIRSSFLKYYHNSSVNN